MRKHSSRVLVPIAVLLAGISAYTYYRYAEPYVAIAYAAAALVVLLCCLAYLNGRDKRVNDMMDRVFSDNENAASELVRLMDVPIVVFDDSGRITWRNAAFTELRDCADIKQIITGFDAANAPKAMSYDFGGKSFQLMSIPVERREREKRLTFQYWMDRTEALHYSRLYEEQMPTVALIYLDNYEELAADRQFRRSEVLTEVERRISNFVESIEGIYRQYDNARFLVVFEQVKLAELEKYRFALLDSVREINTGISQSVTLSIAVGAASRIKDADASSRQAMELALGRGGDQAVVKRGTSYAFYGGKHQVMTKQSKVKSRLFAKALRQLIENSDDVFIMGHKQPDMDCIGAALGIARCARTANRHAYIIMSESNPTIEGALEGMHGVQEYSGVLVTPEQAYTMMRANSVLVVVDTQRITSVLAPELIDRANKLVVMDHHRRSVDSIENTTLNYLEAGASSICEMVTEIMQYFDDNAKPTAFESGALLAGITVDTKHFAVNTGARTFEAASYLRRSGADNRMVKEMFQDDMMTYRNRTRVVQQAQIVEEGIAISVCPEDMPNSQLIAAQAADSLISIRGIEAAFVLAKVGDRVVVSGRSLGKINVQIILERLGGGGHLTVAGAQLANMTAEEAVDKLKDSIKIYLEEGDVS